VFAAKFIDNAVVMNRKELSGAWNQSGPSQFGKHSKSIDCIRKVCINSHGDRRVVGGDELPDRLAVTECLR